MQKLPNPDKTVIDTDKLTGYCLSTEHQDGKHKAKVFKSVLNIEGKDVEVLRTALLKAVRNNMAIQTKHNAYGQKYIIDFEMSYSGKTAKVRSAWIVRNNEDFPRLITCYVL
ncbi:MAG: hypothetical protein GY749_29735 [Desulfobacteraceae bacterium]|nr:hypothetical protein [Desulfobacteraceae bacterium]